MPGGWEARPLMWTDTLLVSILDEAWRAVERRMWEKALGNGAARKEEVHVGMRLLHRALGPGVVTRLEDELVYVDFDAGERSFQLWAACAKRLFLKR